MDKIFERLSSTLTPSRYFFRVVTAGLLIVILLSQFPWTEKLFVRILDFPDLRHQVGPDVSKKTGLDSTKLKVVNLGFGRAENVLVHVSVRQGNIGSYQIDSQELYKMKTTDLKGGVLDIWLDRLGSGASVDIELTGKLTGLTGKDFVTNTVMMSVVSDQGSSIPGIDPSKSFSGQVGTYKAKVTGVFSETRKIIWEAPSVQGIRNWISTRPMFAEMLKMGSKHEFQTVSLAALIIIFLIVIFLPDGFMLLIPLITGSIVWLFFDFQISAREAIVIAIIVFILYYVWGAIVAGGMEEPAGCFGGFGIWLVLNLVVGGIAALWYGDAMVSAKWVLGLTTVFITFIVIWIISGLSGEPKASKGNSRSQTTPQ